MKVYIQKCMKILLTLVIVTCITFLGPLSIQYQIRTYKDISSGDGLIDVVEPTNIKGYPLVTDQSI